LPRWPTFFTLRGGVGMEKREVVETSLDELLAEVRRVGDAEWY
jgi:hypothetical protein